MCNSFAQGRAFPRIVFSDDVFTGHPERKSRVQKIVGRYLGQIEQIVREGQQQGCIRREVVPKTAAMLFLGMVVPAAVLWHLSDGGFNVTQHAARAWQMYRVSLTSEGA